MASKAASVNGKGPNRTMLEGTKLVVRFFMILAFSGVLISTITIWSQLQPSKIGRYTPSDMMLHHGLYVNHSTESMRGTKSLGPISLESISMEQNVNNVDESVSPIPPITDDTSEKLRTIQQLLSSLDPGLIEVLLGEERVAEQPRDRESTTKPPHGDNQYDNGGGDGGESVFDHEKFTDLLSKVDEMENKLTKYSRFTIQNMRKVSRFEADITNIKNNMDKTPDNIDGNDGNDDGDGELPLQSEGEGGSDGVETHTYTDNIDVIKEELEMEQELEEEEEENNNAIIANDGNYAMNVNDANPSTNRLSEESKPPPSPQSKPSRTYIDHQDTNHIAMENVNVNRPQSELPKDSKATFSNDHSANIFTSNSMKSYPSSISEGSKAIKPLHSVSQWESRPKTIESIQSSNSNPVPVPVPQYDSDLKYYSIHRPDQFGAQYIVMAGCWALCSNPENHCKYLHSELSDMSRVGISTQNGTELTEFIGIPVADEVEFKNAGSLLETGKSWYKEMRGLSELMDPRSAQSWFLCAHCTFPEKISDP